MTTPKKAKTDESSQGTLAGAGGSIIGAGIAELATNTTVGLTLVFLGAALLVIRAGF